MENYRGVKFRYHQSTTTFSFDQRLSRLNQWAYLFSQLGLAPVHDDGAYGNHSYRTGDSSFMITKSAMIPAETLQPDDFCHVIGFDEKTTAFITEGIAIPSSESFLHNAIYQSQPHIHAILHGHCSLLNIHAKALNIPTTKNFQDYGTQELAESALEVINQKTVFFILKNHGLVALGEDIDSAGKMTLQYYSKLIALLQNN
ncbi:MAG: class II aldolase/adducin family protein [Desulforhopalus sp.]